jgi:GNAT superfamily N-acetyltransferase
MARSARDRWNLRRYGRIVDDVRFAVVDAGSDEAQWAMSEYFAELDARFPTGFDAGDGLAEARISLNPPRGVFVLAYSADQPVGCGGVNFLDGDQAEIKRMWVSERARGRGVAKRLLARLEDEVRAAGRHTVVLDTNRTLTPAMAMYESAGYVDIDRYNDNPYAQRWFGKSLT